MGMDIGGGFGAGGAVDGLQTLIANRMKDRMFAEQQREAMAREQIQRDQLTEQSKYRQEMQRSNDLWRQGQLADKANAEGNREFSNVTHMVDTMSDGEHVDPTGGALLQKWGYGGKLKPESNGVLMTGMPGVSEPTTAAAPPAAIATDPGFLFTGTRKQAESDANRGSRDTNAANALGEKTTRDQQTYDATMAKIAAGAANTAHQDTVSGKSYDNSVKQIDTLSKPVELKTQNLRDLRGLLNDHTSQSDALIAPKLLSVSTGTGTGLRMNSAELNRINDARTIWESLQVKLRSGAINPSEYQQLSEAQRQNIYQIVGRLESDNQRELGHIQKARQTLYENQGNVDTHRAVIMGLHDKLAGGSDASAPKQIRYDVNGNPVK